MIFCVVYTYIFLYFDPVLILCHNKHYTKSLYVKILRAASPCMLIMALTYEGLAGL